MNGLHYIYAEYCPGDFYWGWWIYAAPIAEGKPDRGRAFWIQHNWQLDRLMAALGLHILHEYRYDNHQRYAHTFLRAYPDGLLANVERDGRTYEVLAAENLWDYARQMREDQLLGYKAHLQSLTTAREED